MYWFQVSPLLCLGVKRIEVWMSLEVYHPEFHDFSVKFSSWIDFLRGRLFTKNVFFSTQNSKIILLKFPSWIDFSGGRIKLFFLEMQTSRLFLKRHHCVGAWIASKNQQLVNTSSSVVSAMWPSIVAGEFPSVYFIFYLYDRNSFEITIWVWVVQNWFWKNKSPPRMKFF